MTRDQQRGYTYRASLCTLPWACQAILHTLPPAPYPSLRDLPSPRRASSRCVLSTRTCFSYIYIYIYVYVCIYIYIYFNRRYIYIYPSISIYPYRYRYRHTFGELHIHIYIYIYEKHVRVLKTQLEGREKTLDQEKENHEENDMALEEEYEEWLDKPKEEYTKMPNAPEKCRM